MKKTLLNSITLLIVLNISVCYAQNEWEDVKLGTIDKAVGKEVSFLEKEPVIDGKLDEDLNWLPVRYFPLASKRKNEKLVPINFRLAYGTSFLYVFIEAEANHLTFRDRAYQNGDGFVVTIAKPLAGNAPADEYYDLACSAVNKQELEWTRRIFWNYNVNSIFVRTSNETVHQFSENNGKISFEVILPWKDIKPLHPWLNSGIGFNITFCKATEPEGMIYYQIVDEGLRSLTKRNYTLLKFQEPVIKGLPQTFVSFKKGHIFEGDNIPAEIITAAGSKGTDNINFEINTSGINSTNLYSKSINYKKGISRINVSIPSNTRSGANYQICYNSTSNSKVVSKQPFTILPRFTADKCLEILDKENNRLAESSVNTIKFLVNETAGKLNALKDYENSQAEFQNITTIMNYLESVKKGTDTLMSAKGFIRKAYKSNLDKTLQPYFMYLPENYDKTKKYPLIVFLHGSESYETNFPQRLIPQGFIGLSPFGRGTSNAFTKDNAQEDIAEAIDAVKKDYNIDASRILISGFSMGGYGAYRTYFETPGKFRAVASFSGGPSLGRNYSKGAPAPDFMDDKNLSCFKNVPVFIYHGEKDKNVLFDITQKLKEKLTNAGARVDFYFDPDKGHGTPSDNALKAYMDWVDKIMK